MNNKKSMRILAILALICWGIFAVSIVIFFSSYTWGAEEQTTLGMVSAGLTLGSGIFGALLYVLVRFMMKEKKNIVTEDGTEPEFESDEAESGSGGEEPAESEETEEIETTEAAVKPEPEPEPDSENEK